jgi:hypothetical protein
MKNKELNIDLEITDEKLYSLNSIIKPVVKREDKLYYIKEVNLRNESFAWNPKITIEAQNLTKFAEVLTYHTYGYMGLFKPSIAEVLAQIPDELINECVAFEIQSELGKEAIRGDYHISNTTLYKKEESFIDQAEKLICALKEVTSLSGKLLENKNTQNLYNFKDVFQEAYVHMRLLESLIESYNTFTL